MSRLSTYRGMRNFKHTAEPRGQSRSASGHRHFVIQKHAARSLHYDLRLELHGVLKSWAVPKGPSTDPSQKRLAIEVEDHPLEYARFHGTIPKGEYGAGKVTIWDQGQWKPLGDPDQGLKKGHLNFELDGKRLRGEWTLVRGGKSGPKPIWFLFKHKQKAETTFIRPELCLLVDKVPEGDEWIHEIKLDGYRIEGLVNGSHVRLLSRNGKDWTDKLPKLRDELASLGLKDAILDGEVVALDDAGKSDFQRLQNAFRDRQQNEIYYYVFDLLRLNGGDLTREPLKKRKELLARALTRKSRKNRCVRFTDYVKGGAPVFEQACRLGLEGIVSKNLAAPYTSSRNGDWRKIKCHKRQEFVITGFTAPRGSRKGLGALLLGVFEPNGELRQVGRVGTGFTRESLAEVHKRLVPLETSKEGDVTWVKPKLVCEIQFAAWTQDRLLRQAVYMGLREDKPSREVKRETTAATGGEAASESAAPAKPAYAGLGSGTKGNTMEPEISNPSKILISPHITKLDLAHYYRDIQEWILPHIANRPLAIVRCPDGHNKECFFQKHPQTEASKWLAVEDLSDLFSLVGLAALELHAWGSRCADLEHPDRVVFDLDPGPDVPWKALIEAAVRLKKLLLDFDLESFVKTTGGKGLHIVLPIEPHNSWADAKNFSRDVARALEETFPELYVASSEKNKRRGKIFIDYLRNDRGSTSVAVYSTRALSGAPVSTPVSWTELPRITASDQFTLADIPARLREFEPSQKKDPWKDFFKLRQRLPKAQFGSQLAATRLRRVA